MSGVSFAVGEEQTLQKGQHSASGDIVQDSGQTC